MSSETQVTTTALGSRLEELDVEESVGSEAENCEAAPGERYAEDNEGVEDEGGHALDLPEILQEIFVHLPQKDLLNCSLVNKTWYRESRSVMQENREMVVTTDEISPCFDLYRLNDHLKELDNVPVNGLHIKILEREHVCMRPVGIRECCDVILEKLKLRFLTIDWNAEINEDTWGNQIMELSKRVKCPAVQLIIEVLKKRPSELKELRLIQLPRRARLFTVEDMEEGNVFLEKLEVLEATWHVDFRNEDEWLLESYGLEPERPMLPDIIAVSPNLKELKKEIQPGEDVDAAVPHGLTHVVKYLHFSPMEPKEDEIYEKFARRNPKLSAFRASLRVRSHLEQSCWLTMKQLLVSSRNTLKEFHVDAYIGAMLEPLRIPSLPNVKNRFLLTIDYGPWAQKVRDELFKLNFTRLLPNVTAVEIFEHERRIENFLDFCDDFLQTEMANEDNEASGHKEENTARIRSVKLSSFTADQLDEDAFDYIFKLFPHAERFSMCDLFGFGPYEFIWEHGGHIKELSLDYSETEEMGNMDAMFCGLELEEIELLQQQSYEVLQSLNIVPTSFSILNSDLEKLNIYLGNVPHESCNETFFLSRVTGYLFLKRMPKLEVTVHYDGDPKCLRHLAPFARIQSTPVANT